MSAAAPKAPHPLVTGLRQSLPARHRRAGLALAHRVEWHLDRLVEALAAGAPKLAGPSPSDPHRGRDARRVLERLQVAWNDGDENRVRCHLDGVPAREEATWAAQAHRLLLCAGELAETGARAETLWFFAWYLESAMCMTPEADAARGPRSADSAGPTP